MFKTFASALIAYSASAVTLDHIENAVLAEIAAGTDSQTSEYKDPTYEETVLMIQNNYGYKKWNKPFIDLGPLRNLVEEFDGEQATNYFASDYKIT